MTLKDRIRELANERGMSLPALEAKLGFGNGTIVKWDKASPNSDKLSKVADFFNVSIDYLLGREPKEKNDQTIELSSMYFSIAKDAQDNGIDPADLQAIIDIVKRRKKEN